MLGGRVTGRFSRIVNAVSFWIRELRVGGGVIVKTSLTLLSGFFIESDRVVIRTGGTAMAEAGGRLNVNTTAVGVVGTSLTSLIGYMLPRNTLSQDGQVVRVTAWGTCKLTGAVAKTLRLDFGVVTLFTVTLTPFEASSWRIDALLVRTGFQNLEVIASFLQSGSTTLLDVERSAPIQNLDNTANLIRCVGQGGEDDDIVQEGLMVELIK